MGLVLKKKQSRSRDIKKNMKFGKIDTVVTARRYRVKTASRQSENQKTSPVRSSRFPGSCPVTSYLIDLIRLP